jgi:hypothetical protein
MGKIRSGVWQRDQFNKYDYLYIRRVVLASRLVVGLGSRILAQNIFEVIINSDIQL